MAFKIKNGVLEKYIKEENVTKVTIPDGVISIGDMAFFDCKSLTGIAIPDSVSSIGYGAFAFCENLKNITIPDNITIIRENTFECCESLKSIIIPDSVKSIETCAFYRCTKLTNITIPDGVKINEYGVFYYCGMLTSVKIYKDDANVSLTLKHHLEFAESRTDLHMFIVSNIDNRQQYFNDLKPCYQISLALFMTFAYPQESSYYISYLKNNAEDAGRYLVDEENINLLYRFLEYGFVTKDNIDKLIAYAVEHTQNGGSAEPQLVFIRYKNDNFGCQGADAMDKFML